MNQLALRLFLGGAVILLGGCSDDDGSDVPAKDPSAQAGSGGAAGGGGSGGAAGTGGSGAGGTAGNGGAGGGSPPDAGPGCTPVFPDAGVFDAGAGDAGDAGDAAAGGPVGAVGFAADIHPILAMRCGPCHVTDFSGGHNVASADLMVAYGFASDLKDTILLRVNGGGMPPSEAGCDGPLGSPGCVTVAEFELMERWAAQCFPP